MTSTLRLLVASDIFGHTEALNAALAQLVLQGAALRISICQPDSCRIENRRFANDEQAYQAFMQQGGLAVYQQQLSTALSQQQPDLVLGFSAGAAALWCALSELPAAATPARALLCYGGQIRQHVALQPKLAVTCLWSDETHFDVRALQCALAVQTNVLQQHWPYHHGFINPLSKNYQRDGATEFWRRCQLWLSGGDF